MSVSLAAILAMSGLFLESGVPELRIDVGPGYRVYDQQKGSRLIILLAGGDKSCQARDIEQALMLSHQMKEDE